jgi:hypothetical protein
MVALLSLGAKPIQLFWNKYAHPIRKLDHFINEK